MAETQNGEASLRGIAFARKIAVTAFIIQFTVHAMWQLKSGNPQWMVPRLISWLHDCVIILFIYSLFSIIFKHFGPGPLKPFISVFHILAWFFTLCALMIYPGHVPDFLNFPVNIFAVDAGAAAEFSKQFLYPGELAATAFLAASAIFISGLIKPVDFLKPGPFIKIFFTVSVLATLAASSPNPIVFSFQDSLLSYAMNRERLFPLLIRPDLAAGEKKIEGFVNMPDHSNFSDGLKSKNDLFAPDFSSPEISNVVIIVMETVESVRFQKEILENKNSYIGSRRSEYKYFSNYHTTNLDSYTSLLAMLTSVFIPFPAYSDHEIYSAVQSAPNLAGALKKTGMKCMFVSTAQNQPFIPVKNEWDKIITRRDIPIDRSMAHIDSPPIESAVEDRAARPVIVEFMKNHAGTLVLQECVFGHTRAWLDLTGMSQLDYYDLYVKELSEALEKEGLRGKTLIVLLADHGSRRDAAVYENYHIPLIIWGPKVPGGNDERFFSHLDLPGLLYGAIRSKPFQVSYKTILTTGHSGRWIYGEINDKKEYQFLDNARGTVLSQNGRLDSKKLYGAFQAYLNNFSSSFPDSRKLVK